MAGYRISERKLKDGTISNTVIIDKVNVTKDELQIIKEFYVPAGYKVKYKQAGITTDDILAYVEKYDKTSLEHFKKQTKDKSVSFMTVKAEFKQKYPDYPKAPKKDSAEG